MKNRIYTVLLATYLIVGCSGGGGTSGAGGGRGTTVIVGGVLLSANLSNSENFSIDTFATVCSVDEDATPPKITYDGLFTQMEPFTLTATNVSSSTGSLFPTGIFIDSYSVSFNAQNDAPFLSPRTFDITATQINASPLTIHVIIANVGVIKKEYMSKFPNKSRDSDTNNYIVTITMRGHTLSSRKMFSITASNVFEFGNFNNC